MATAQTIRQKTVAANKKFRVTEHKFFLLFVYLIAVLLYYPYVKENSFSYTVFRIVGSAGIFLAVYAVKVRRTLLICAVVLAIPAGLQRILLFRADAGLFSLIGILLSFAFDVFIVVLVFRRVFTEQQVKSETVFGAICIYLLIGYSFASIYAMIATLQPRAFYIDPMLNLHSVPNRFDFIYYSFATMTSMGAAGIAPVTGQARSFTVIETTLGVLYLAVLIARLMAGYRHSSAERD
ncbi:MAG: ion channel [Candidatus Korobacteraceae bacterium]